MDTFPMKRDGGMEGREDNEAELNNWKHSLRGHLLFN